MGDYEQKLQQFFDQRRKIVTESPEDLKKYVNEYKTHKNIIEDTLQENVTTISQSYQLDQSELERLFKECLTDNDKNEHKIEQAELPAWLTKAKAMELNQEI